MSCQCHSCTIAAPSNFQHHEAMNYEQNMTYHQKTMLLPFFLLELAEKQSTERQQTWLWEYCDILSQGYPYTFRATDKCIFLQSSKCITGYQIKDLLFFYDIVCSLVKNWWQSDRENQHRVQRIAPSSWFTALPAPPKKVLGFSWHSSCILQGTEV